MFLRNLTQEQHTKQNLERLISARLAEKVALNFYARAGLPTEDVSVTQITNPQEGDWRLFDLRVGSDGVDVKNARPDRYKNRHAQKYSYVELRVQKPGKVDLSSRRDVHIAGVLSPNFSLEHFLDPKTIPNHYVHRDVTFLGTSKPNQLWKLQQEFTMQGFEIDFRRLYHGNQYFLPKWMFDYPTNSYRVRDENLEKIKNIIWPQEEMFWDEHHLNLAPCFLAQGEDYTKLLHWVLYDDAEICFVRKVLSWRRYMPPSLPFVFLTVLWHFVRMAQLHNTKWHPQKYRSLLYCNEKTDTCWPLFVYDPQETVNDLITSLENLWQHRQAVIQEFRQFKLAGAGILRGRSTSQDQWQTLVAYCGECYYHPLVWGTDDDCKKCGRLYCSRCGYCSDQCREYTMSQDQTEILEL